MIGREPGPFPLNEVRAPERQPRANAATPIPAWRSHRRVLCDRRVLSILPIHIVALHKCEVDVLRSAKAAKKRSSRRSTGANGGFFGERALTTEAASRVPCIVKTEV